MQVDEPFPLESVPSRVRQAILSEFKGRWPSVREVSEIPDAYWLATPAMGRRFLQMIREVAHASSRQADVPVRPRLTDAELLDRLESLQRELQWLHATVKAKTRRMPRSRDRFHGPARERSRSRNELSPG